MSEFMVAIPSSFVGYPFEWRAMVRNWLKNCDYKQCPSWACKSPMHESMPFGKGKCNFRTFCATRIGLYSPMGVYFYVEACSMSICKNGEWQSCQRPRHKSL